MKSGFRRQSRKSSPALRFGTGRFRHEQELRGVKGIRGPRKRGSYKQRTGLESASQARRVMGKGRTYKGDENRPRPQRQGGKDRWKLRRSWPWAKRLPEAPSNRRRSDIYL